MKQHLIVQGRDVETRDLKELAQLTAAQRIEAIDGRAFRLVDVQFQADVARRCAAAQLDFACVSSDQTMSRLGL